MLSSSPRPARQPRERLASLKDPRGARARRPSRRPQVHCPECNGTNIVDVDGSQVCGDCGVTINDSNIVAEVTFGESAAGAAVVQGGFVGDGARHANTLGPAFRRAGGGMESREVTENQGRDEIRRQTNALDLNDNVSDQAFSIYKLAANANFIQGRRINIVASVCLYVACRRDKNNQTLLMDFSEAIAVNVFKLGQTYQDLKKALVLPDNDPLGIRPVVDVENLILKFARKLEFGNSLYKVAEDAAKIMKRMKRDWMVTGRRPSGLCGACIILAARMNNFRRTVREVVYVVKVADVTVAKRLEEFKNTRSSDLTVDQFRELGLRLKLQHDPPSLYERRAREEQQRLLEQTSRDGEEQPTTDSQTQVARIQGPRRDADGFAIPALPIDPNLLSTRSNLANVDSNTEGDNAPESDIGEPPSKKLKRRKAAKAPKAPKPPRNPVPQISEVDLVLEADLEDEMEQILNDTSIFSAEQSAFIEAQSHARSAAATDPARKQTTARTIEPAHNQTATPAATPVTAMDGSAAASDSTAATASTSLNDTEIGEDEFEDDPEVKHCLLSEEERKIKERIWVTHNEDWLRAQQAKILKKALDEANGTTSKPKKKRKHGRMGDGSLLEGGTPVEDAADATQRMLEKRANKFSRHINYDKLNKFYAGLRGKSARAGTMTEATTTTEGEAVEEAESEAGGNVSEDSAEDASDMADGLPTPSGTQDKRSRKAGEGSARPRDEGSGGNDEGQTAAGQDDDEEQAGNEANWEVDEEEDVLDDEEDVEEALDDLAYGNEDYGAGFDEEDLADDY